MEENLDDRKRKILRAIIEEYIQTAEPVSSGNLSKNYGLNCSSATIRNDMADLEKIGFLEKPHTSAGRVPSQKGYRYYVDQLLNEEDINIEEMKYIKEKLETKVNELEDLTKIATSTLSEITQYTTVSIGPQVSKHTIVDIKFVLLGSRVLMAVILTDSGIIRESIIKFDEDVSEKQVENITAIFKTKLVGKPLEKLDEPLEEYIISEVKTGVNIIKKIIEELNRVIEEESKKVRLEGTKKLLNLPEFKKIDVAQKLFHILDENSLVADILNTGIAEDINVFIGAETEYEELKDFSIVTFNHLLEGKDIGTIGIIGPTRMDYSKVISVMKYISRKLNEDFKNGKF